jgi:hypothetical protein
VGKCGQNVGTVLAFPSSDHQYRLHGLIFALQVDGGAGAQPFNVWAVITETVLSWLVVQAVLRGWVDGYPFCDQFVKPQCLAPILAGAFVARAANAPPPVSPRAHRRSRSAVEAGPCAASRSARGKGR